jgi:hypothetical protein
MTSGDGTAHSWQGDAYGKLCGGADTDMGGQREREGAASTGAIAFRDDPHGLCQFIICASVNVCIRNGASNW